MIPTKVCHKEISQRDDTKLSQSCFVQVLYLILKNEIHKEDTDGFYKRMSQNYN